MQIRSPLSGLAPIVSNTWGSQLDDPNSAEFKAFRALHFDPGNVPGGIFIPQPPIPLPAVQSVQAGGIAKPSVISMPSPNYGNRPAGTDIDTIVLHHTASGGSAQNIGKFFQNPAAEVSAHYTIGKDGAIVQSVPDSKRAWHAGPSTFKGKEDVNDYSIGIEIVNLGNNKDPYTDKQYAALIDLVAYLVKAHGVPMERITGHRDIAVPRGRKVDPSDNFDWGRVRRGVEAKLNGSKPSAPAAPKPEPAKAPPASSSSSSGTYAVRKGDSLSKIARDVLGDMNRWREIYDLNQGVIGSNPNLIHPGMTLKLPSQPEAAKPEPAKPAPQPEAKPEPPKTETPPATQPEKPAANPPVAQPVTPPATQPATPPATQPVAPPVAPSTPVLIGVAPSAVWAQIQAMTNALIAQAQPGAYPQTAATYPQAAYPQVPAYPQPYPQVTYPQAAYPQVAAYPQAPTQTAYPQAPYPQAPVQPAAPAPTYVPAPTGQWTGPMVAQAYPAAPTTYATAPSAYAAPAPAMPAPNPLGVEWVG